MSAATPLEALFETIRKGIETGRVVIEIRAATEQTSLPVDEEAVVIARSIFSGARRTSSEE